MTEQLTTKKIYNVKSSMVRLVINIFINLNFHFNDVET